MIERSKTWDQIKPILDVNDFSYDDIFDESLKQRRIICITDTFTYTASLELSGLTPAPVGSEERDFDDNYLSKSNKIDITDSFDFTVLAGATSNLEMVWSDENDVNVDAHLKKITIRTSASAAGDWMKLLSIDKDNVLGGGVNVIQRNLFKRRYIEAGGNTIECDIKYKIPAGVYLRCRYVSVGGADVGVHLTAQYKY